MRECWGSPWRRAAASPDSGHRGARAGQPHDCHGLCRAGGLARHRSAPTRLTIDVSGSVEDNHFKLQRKGIAAALKSEEVVAALSNGVNQTIEIAVVEWAEEQ